MQFDPFLGQVQARARLADRQQALSATRATLQTLAERLDPGEAGDFAAQLPRELGDIVRQSARGPERFDLDEFIRRVSEREGVDRPAGTYHARVVIEVLGEAISAGELRDIRGQLPAEFDPLFESGSRGRMRT